MLKEPNDEVVVFLGVIFSEQLLMGVAQVNMGASEVRQSMPELRAVSALDRPSVGGDVVGVEANFFLQDCRCSPGWHSHGAGAQ